MQEGRRVREVTAVEKEVARIIWYYNVRSTWHQLESSNLELVSYSRKNKTLIIVFKSGAVYQYYNVSRYQFEKLRQAESKGRYFHKNIRTKYRFEKLEATA